MNTIIKDAVARLGTIVIPRQEFNVYAFLYKRTKLISMGVNQMLEPSAKALKFGSKFSVNGMKQFPYIHAEIDAISKVWGKIILTGREKLVVIRVRRDGSFGNARPCNNCSIVLSALGINRISYTTPNGFQDF